MEHEPVILPKYVFRGTSYGYAGNEASILTPCTHTTRNPVKATLFAMRCRIAFDEEPIVYIAKTEKLISIRLIEPDVLSHLEEEYNWEIAPLDFRNYCEGYITLEEMKNILR